MTDWKEFLGDSIFTTDGTQWSESIRFHIFSAKTAPLTYLGRNLLRPLFIKTKVRDFEIFERHTEKLMKLIGGKGEVVDVSDLFYRSVNLTQVS